ncbi:hypothetical protein [Sulfuricella denitrificans]|uniref:hypothetical protein n=1 Tax=Sulfuricella denitrificans TaxID=649841 RepID=UPI00059F60D6|nr:hypothetical protein [Sulfuricella denitrificans]
MNPITPVRIDSSNFLDGQNFKGGFATAFVIFLKDVSQIWANEVARPEANLAGRRLIVFGIGCRFSTGKAGGKQKNQRADAEVSTLVDILWFFEFKAGVANKELPLLLPEKSWKRTRALSRGENEPQNHLHLPT